MNFPIPVRVLLGRKESRGYYFLPIWLCKHSDDHCKQVWQVQTVPPIVVSVSQCREQGEGAGTADWGLGVSLAPQRSEKFNRLLH